MSKRLLQRNTRYLLTWLPVVLLACSVAFYVLLQMQAHHMQEKQLLLKQQNVWSAFISKAGNIDKHLTGEYDIVQVEHIGVNKTTRRRDTLLYYADQQKWLPFEMVSNVFAWHNNHYQVTTYVSSTEILHLIIKVFIAEFVILILLLMAIVFLSRKSSGFLWQPFFASVDTLQQYDIKRSDNIELPDETGTTEFDQLNKTATKLIQQSNAAYRQQKEFVENASHEMQTPLAIIRTKIELLSSEPNLTERQAWLLSDITEANERLSQMNRTLLLLAKIENNQFPDTSVVNLSVLLQEVIDTFRNHYDNFPELNATIEANVMVNANKSLIEILTSNLVKNSVVHNIQGGKIAIALTHRQLSIANTGNLINVETGELFDRFKKAVPDNKTTGLGLAIVSQIVHLYGYTIAYEHEQGLHVITVTFG